MQHLVGLECAGDGDWLNTTFSSLKVNVGQLYMLSLLLYSKYNDYDNIILNHSAIPPNSVFMNNKDLLIEYYAEPPAALKRLLIERRREHGLTECPYCGFPFSPDTLDHFLPKDFWPEYSIFPNNLVPQCRGCAPIKSSKYYCNTTHSALFIHPIRFNYLSKVRFKIDVYYDNTINNVSFNVSFKTTQVFGNIEKQRIILHLKSLNIVDRIKEYCRKTYKRWLNIIRAQHVDIRVALGQRISEKPDEPFSQDWKTALYKGMLLNDNLINYLTGLTQANRVHVAATELQDFALD